MVMNNVIDIYIFTLLHKHLKFKLTPFKNNSAV